ncbi:hypothetical protein LLEC1_01596 [Akanthomyces lecanii]|uniref:Uncharacterized protein n=1 Tax=Cordyceps confragosa TaxID=2714763 RepID=A0A179I6J7_CORDF|nr:hypothetical protein LLEC1_01596 [Akanthomyces lecanii]
MDSIPSSSRLPPSLAITRRQFLESHSAAHPEVPARSYLSSYAHYLPVLSTTHATDLLQTFFRLAPNFCDQKHAKILSQLPLPPGPQCRCGCRSILAAVEGKPNTFVVRDAVSKNNHLTDDFRSEQYAALLKLGNSARQ